MTNDNNGAGVLAAMDSVADACTRGAVHAPAGRRMALHEAAATCEQARAAVAELIEALRNSDDLLREFCARTGADMTQLVANRAALARVGGAK